MKIIKIAFKIAKNLPRLVLSFLFVPIYHLVGLLPRDKNLWVFMGRKGNNYDDNSRVFMEYVVKNTNGIRCVWLTDSKEGAKRVRAKGLDACYVRSVRFALLTLRAGKLFAINEEVGFCGFLKNIDNYYLWHGMPLKRIKRESKPNLHVEYWTQDQKDTRNNCFYDFLCYANNNIFIWQDMRRLDTGMRTLTSSRFFAPIM